MDQFVAKKCRLGKNKIQKQFFVYKCTFSTSRWPTSFPNNNFQRICSNFVQSKTAPSKFGIEERTRSRSSESEVKRDVSGVVEVVEVGVKVDAELGTCSHHGGSHRSHQRNHLRIKNCVFHRIGVGKNNSTEWNCYLN